MKRLFFLVLSVVFLPLSLFPDYLSFKTIGKYENNAVYTDIQLFGRYAFLVAGNNGVHIFDVSNPYFPKRISVIGSMDHSYAIDVKGFHLYVADGTGGVRIFDIRDKKKPEQISFIPTNQKSLDLKVSGDYCFIADWRGGLRVIDISKPFFPYEVSSWDKSDYVNSIEVVHDYVFFADEKGVLSLLISDAPDSLDDYKRISGVGPVNTLVSDGQLLFAASHERGLLVAEIMDVSRPLVQELPGRYRGIENMFLSGFYLYIVKNGMIKVLNVLVPFNPYISGNISLSAEVSAVYIRGNMLYAACGFDGFKILKISE